eukprot:141464-Chlamydomonas_euryale.AAC.1
MPSTPSRSTPYCGGTVVRSTCTIVALIGGRPGRQYSTISPLEYSGLGSGRPGAGRHSAAWPVQEQGLGFWG